MTGPDYRLLDSQLKSLLADEADPLAAASNFVAHLYNWMDDINWLGIYVLRGEQLVLGPFQGKPACTHIALGSGVCGTAAATRCAQRVDDVHRFAGHIVCDADSRSELVVPLVIDNTLLGVLDIDSPKLARFSERDQAGVEKACRTFCGLQADRDRFI